ncbi:MAG TPA: META domain-containing protein [Anaerolineales bacterium]
MKQIMIGLLAVMILAACGGGASASIEGGWKLVSYNGIHAVANVETTIEFKDGQMSGNVGCNGFGGGYSMDGDTITFDPVESTLMFCEDPVGEQELGVFGALQGATKFALDGILLTITSEDGSSSIVLELK